MPEECVAWEQWHESDMIRAPNDWIASPDCSHGEVACVAALLEVLGCVTFCIGLCVHHDPAWLCVGSGFPATAAALGVVGRQLCWVGVRNRYRWYHGLVKPFARRR